MRSIPVIIDTDAGADDLMAIAYLLAHPEISVLALTVVHGLAHVGSGAHNLRRLLRVAEREDIPVFEGETRPLRGSREFPPAWREMTDELPGVRLPECTEGSLPGAVEFLRERFRDKTKPVRILALGPLTNLALALSQSPAQTSIQDIWIMGGAVNVPGNLMDGNRENGFNEVAEWNIYCDPEAASTVLECPISKVLVPLDATNQVPLDRTFVDRFRKQEFKPLGRVVADVLTMVLPLIDGGLFYAWDPLAAVALVEPSVVETHGARLRVRTTGDNLGQTEIVRWDDLSDLQLAVGADAEKFRRLFEQPLLA